MKLTIIHTYEDEPDNNGIIIAEEANGTLKVMKVPRNLIRQKLVAEHSLDITGAYILLGKDDNKQDTIYVGEGDVLPRLESHKKTEKKKFFDHALVVTNNTDTLNKAYVQYFEYIWAKKAVESGRYKVVNGNSPQEPVLGVFDRHNIQDLISKAEILINIVAGHDIFEKVIDRPPQEECSTIKCETTPPTNNVDISSMTFFLKGPRYHAKGKFSNGEFVVLRGSKTDGAGWKSPAVMKRFSEIYANKEILQSNDDGSFTLLKNIPFKTIGGAGAFITTRNWSSEHWINSDGISVKNFIKIRRNRIRRKDFTPKSPSSALTVGLV